MKISICNWGKFNTKESSKTPYWFRVNIDIPISRTLFGLSTTAKWVWICLLAEAMRQKSGEFELDLEWASHYWSLTKTEISKSIESLSKNNALRVDSELTPSSLGADSALQYNTDNTIQDNIVNSQSSLPELCLLWNRLVKEKNPKVRECKGTRLDRTKARLKENPDLEYWKSVLNRLNQSTFLCGETTSWKATYDWFVTPGNHTKIMEGNYDDPVKKSPTKVAVTSFMKQLEEQSLKGASGL